MEEFDYNKAVSELEAMVQRVEDPSVGLDEIDKCIKRSADLVRECRTYLRTLKTKTEENL